MMKMKKNSIELTLQLPEYLVKTIKAYDRSGDIDVNKFVADSIVNHREDITDDSPFDDVTCEYPKNTLPLVVQLSKTQAFELGIPDIIASFKNRHNEDNTDRKAKHFFVEADEIRQNGYDLSINKYKEIERVKVEYEPVRDILTRLESTEGDYLKGYSELYKMLEE